MANSKYRDLELLKESNPDKTEKLDKISKEVVELRNIFSLILSKTAEK